jgi:hypothetical protein
VITQTQPAGAPGVPSNAPKVTLQQLVKNTLDGRRAVCEERALAALKAGQYHEACDQLTLADATAMEEPEQRVYLKMLFCYAALAAQQYQEAFNAMRWVISRENKDGGKAVPAALGRCRDVASLYGNSKDYSDQVALLDRTLPREGDPSMQPATRLRASVLRAIAAWGGNDSANAKYHAQRAAALSPLVLEPEERAEYWPRLEQYLAAAEKGGDSPGFVPTSPVETGKRPTTRPGLLTIEAVPISGTN